MVARLGRCGGTGMQNGAGIFVFGVRNQCYLTVGSLETPELGHSSGIAHTESGAGQGLQEAGSVPGCAPPGTQEPREGLDDVRRHLHLQAGGGSGRPARVHAAGWAAESEPHPGGEGMRKKPQMEPRSHGATEPRAESSRLPRERRGRVDLRLPSWPRGHGTPGRAPEPQPTRPRQIPAPGLTGEPPTCPPPPPCHPPLLANPRTASHAPRGPAAVGVWRVVGPSRMRARSLTPVFVGAQHPRCCYLVRSPPWEVGSEF